MSKSAAKGTMGNAAGSLDRLPAEILLEISKNLDSKDMNSLSRASGYFQYSEILQTTMFLKDVDNGEGPNDALHHACVHGDESLLQKALQNGAKINGDISSDVQVPCVDILTEMGYVRPLFLAIMSRQFAFATTLVTKYNADPNLAQCALRVLWPAERDLGELPLRFAIDILIAVVAGHPVQPHMPVTLTKAQYDDADELFSALLERSELFGVGPAYDEQLYTRSAFLELAAWPRVPASWFARLLEHSEDPMALMLPQTVHASFMPWEALVTAGEVVGGPGWLSWKDVSPLVLDNTYGEDSRCASHTFKDSILGKLRTIAKYCDITRLRNRRTGEWMMHFMTKFIAIQRDTGFVLQAFDILLSAPSVNVNHLGETFDGEMTMLESLTEHLVWLRKYPGVTRSDTICHNVAGVMKQLLQRGADPCKATYLNSEVLGGGGESLILRVAGCGHTSFSEVLETIIRLHKATTRQISTDVAAHHESRRQTDLDLLARAQRQLVMCDMNLVNEHGENALHMACSSRMVCPEVIDCLLRNGVDPVAKNRDGWTPLHKLCGSADLRGQYGLHVVKALMGRLTLRQQAEILKSRSKHSNQSPIDLAGVKKQVLVSRYLKGLRAVVFGER